MKRIFLLFLIAGLIAALGIINTGGADSNSKETSKMSLSEKSSSEGIACSCEKITSYSGLDLNNKNSNSFDSEVADYSAEIQTSTVNITSGNKA